MLLRNWKLILAAIWAMLAVFLIFIETERRASYILLAGVLAIWNLMRWAMQPKLLRVAHRQSKPRNDPISQPYEYNPELDFQKMEREQGERGTRAP